MAAADADLRPGGYRRPSRTGPCLVTVAGCQPMTKRW